MKCYSAVPRLKNITSEYICFFKDGDRFLAGCDKSYLIQSSLSNYTKSEMDRKRRLAGRIVNLKLNRSETQVFVNTQETIYQLQVHDFSKELQKYQCFNNDLF
jgi:hypothetical protein